MIPIFNDIELIMPARNARNRSGPNTRSRNSDPNVGNNLTLAEAKALYPGPVISVKRPYGELIMIGAKRCENRHIALFGPKYDYRGVPILLHIPKSTTKKDIRAAFKIPMVRNDIANSAIYAGMGADEFINVTNCHSGHICAMLWMDNIPDAEQRYRYANVPVDRGNVWYIHHVRILRRSIAGFTGSQTWKFIRNSEILDQVLRQTPVKLFASYSSVLLVNGDIAINACSTWSSVANLKTESLT